MNNRIILRLFLAALSIKILLGLFAVLFVNAGIYHPVNQNLYFQNFNWQHFLHIYFCSDSGWYKVIAENGYADIPVQEIQGWSRPNLHFAFFPLFPMAIRFIMQLTGASFDTAGFIFNILLLYLMIRYFYLFLIQLGIAQTQAFRIVLILLFFPFSLHFYFIYTEALFMTLLMACFLFIARKQWTLLAIAGGLIVLTRPNGIILILPFLIFMLEEDRLLGFSGIKKAMKMPGYYILLAMPLTFACWLIYQHQVTGHYFAFSEAQAGWKKHFMFPLLGLFRNGFWQEQFASFYCIAVMLLALYWLKKWRTSFNLLVWLGILLPLSAGSVISMTRYISVLFPFHMQAGLSKVVNKHFKVILLIFAILQLVCMKYWVEENSLMY